MNTTVDTTKTKNKKMSMKTKNSTMKIGKKTLECVFFTET